MLDKLDLKIIDILQENSRITLTKLGERAGISRQAATRRYNKILEEGYIKKFSVELDHNKLGRTILAYIDIIFEKSFTNSEELESIDLIKQINGVRQINTTVGKKYLTVKIYAKNLGHLNDIIRYLHNNIPDTSTRTVIVNELYFSNKSIKYSEESDNHHSRNE